MFFDVYHILYELEAELLEVCIHAWDTHTHTNIHNLLQGFDHLQLWKLVTTITVSLLILHMILELAICKVGSGEGKNVGEGDIK